MLIQYETAARFGGDAFTEAGNLRLSALLRHFQAAASRHSEEAGLGFEALLARDLIWVVTGMRLRVLREPRPDAEYRVLTWPKPNGTRMFRRDYALLAGDEVLAAAVSQWCVIHYSTRRLAQVELTFPGEYLTRDALSDKIPRLRPGELIPAGTYTVQKGDLDGNDHMNNCRYVDLALEALGRADARDLSVNFARESRLGDELLLSISEDRSMAACRLADGTLVFAAAAEEN